MKKERQGASFLFIGIISKILPINQAGEHASFYDKIKTFSYN
jgi:hypothetical protein